jgi:hypothetical protein
MTKSEKGAPWSGAPSNSAGRETSEVPNTHSATRALAQIRAERNARQLPHQKIARAVLYCSGELGFGDLARVRHLVTAPQATEPELSFLDRLLRRQREVAA